jgi:LuxR family maltose regulon positive regulatory protein
LLSRLADVAERAGAMGYLIEVLVLQALALQALDRPEPALASLEHALCVAEPSGYVRVFVDEGSPMRQLLQQALAKGIRVDYARKLVGAFGEEAAATPWPPSAHKALIEPLSQRETEVLRLLSTHLSSAEMAEVLFVSVHTVRSHIKSIYGKLDVHSRSEAVSRAQSLDLL